MTALDDVSSMVHLAPCETFLRAGHPAEGSTGPFFQKEKKEVSKEIQRARGAGLRGRNLMARRNDIV